MALIKCPVCAKEVDISAGKCPACGYNLMLLTDSDMKRLTALQDKYLLEREGLAKKEKESNWICMTALFCFMISFYFTLSTNGSLFAVIFLMCSIGILAVSYAKLSGIGSKIKVIDNNLQNVADEKKKRIKAPRLEVVKVKYNMLVSELGYNEKNIELDSKMVWFTASDMIMAETLADYEKEAKEYIDTAAGTYPAAISYKKINIQDIQYYTQEGNVQYTTDISGGGGGGSSIGGAIVGGVIAGDAGAIIGSRQKIEDIKSTTITHDSRKTVLRYFEDGAIKTLTWQGFDAYEFFLQNIPDKDLQTLQLSGDKQTLKELPQRIDADSKPVDTEKLEDLAKLYKSGLIDDAEYKQMKAKILGL